MKIICTKEEKENLIHALMNSKTFPCLLKVKGEMACFFIDDCKTCYENKIEWEIKENTNND